MIKKYILFLISNILFLLPTTSFAQGYQPLQAIGTEAANTQTDLSSYLNSVFYAGLGVACGLAVIMIVIGGIQYMSTDAISGKSEGRRGFSQLCGDYSWLYVRI